MRYLIGLILCLSLFLSNSYADELKIVITNNKTGTVLKEMIVSEEENKAVEYYIIDFSQWIIETVKNKIQSRIDAFFTENTDRNVNKIPEEEKRELIKKANVKLRKERENIK